MKRTLVLALILILILAIPLASCKQKVKETKARSVRVILSLSEKSLSTSGAGSVSYYYRAAALFSQSGLTGEQGNWKLLSVTDGQAMLGYVTEGVWQFYVRAVTDSGTVTGEGTSGAVSCSKTSNTVPVLLQSSSSSYGSVGFRITTVAVDSPAGCGMVARYRKVYDGSVLGAPVEMSGDGFWVVTDIGSGRLEYYGVIEKLEKGVYIFDVLAMAEEGGKDVQIGGDSISSVVLGDELTMITGDVSPSDFTGSYLLVDSLVSLDGAIAGTAECGVGEIVVLSWATEDETVQASADRWLWTVDGEDASFSDSPSFTYQPQTEGNHRVSCIAFGSQLGDIGNSCITVKVRRERSAE